MPLPPAKEVVANVEIGVSGLFSQAASTAVTDLARRIGQIEERGGRD